MKKIICTIIIGIFTLLIPCYVSAEMIYEDYEMPFGTVRLTGFNERQIEIAKHLVNVEEKFSLPFEGINDLNNDLMFANNQNPLTPFVKSWKTSVSGNKVTYNVSYWIKPEYARQWIPQEYAKAKSIAEQIERKYETDYAKYQAVEIKLRALGDYNYEAADCVGDTWQVFRRRSYNVQASYAPYGILCNGEGVCQSYAQSYHLVCDMLRLPCISVKGKLAGGNHIWNRVCINGRWYNVDVSENDASEMKVTYFAPSTIDGLYQESNIEWCPKKEISAYKATVLNYEYWYRKGKYVTEDGICDYLDKNYLDKRVKPYRIYVRVKTAGKESSMCSSLVQKIYYHMKNKGYHVSVAVSTMGHGIYEVEFKY